ncbi:MAG: C1 family peptidase [Candidatus Dormibacteraeota bacterium]|nr:C1 family peptidase [Candidatus Dormibacteraeota bacterium]
MIYATGCRKDPYDRRDFAVTRFLRAEPAPDRADHRAEMPEVFDQGHAGTCVACASGYYDKTFQEQREHSWGMDPARHRFSPLFIYGQRADKTGDHGMTIREAMKIINQEGICTLADMPYSDAGIDAAPTAAQLKAAMPFRSKSFARITSIGEAESHLADNCFVAGLLVHQSFMDAPRGRIPMPRRGDPYVGGHALCFVGYERRKSRFHFINSWGPGWGDAGFGTIGYDVFSALLMDAWAMIDAPDTATGRRRR